MEMDVDEFEAKMADIFANPNTDIEEKHIQADDLMCEVLKNLGYELGIEIFENAQKWYA